MPPKKTTQNKGKSNPSTAVVRYTGPTRLSAATQSNDVIVTEINNAGQLITTAGGTISTVFDAYSQASTGVDWASFINLYQEYRILSMEIELIPYNTYNFPTTSTLGPMYTVTDRGTNAALTSLATTVAYDSMKVQLPSKRIIRQIKMDGLDEAGWIANSASPATGSRLFIKTWSSGNVASTTLYDFIARVIVQFRGRQ